MRLLGRRLAAVAAATAAAALLAVTDCQHLSGERGAADPLTDPRARLTADLQFAKRAHDCLLGWAGEDCDACGPGFGGVLCSASAEAAGKADDASTEQRARAHLGSFLAEITTGEDRRTKAEGGETNPLFGTPLATRLPTVLPPDAMAALLGWGTQRGFDAGELARKVEADFMDECARRCPKLQNCRALD